MRSIKEMVKNGQRVAFVRARKGELVYVTECGFEFRVPFDDMGDGVFEAEDKAILYMRWIRKERTALSKGDK